MANQKISQLVELTTPADADIVPIVDDSETSSEKTKQITFANLKLAVTGVGATYGITGAYTATLPTNGVSAAAKFMLGDSSTIIWMYLNVAPPGWKVLTTGSDTVLGIKGGSYSFNVNGGNPDSSATWTISGLTMATHYHTGPSHNHKVFDYKTPGAGVYGQIYNSSGTLIDVSFTNTTEVGFAATAGTSLINVDFYTSNAGTGNTGYNSSSGVSSAGTWRPKASIGKLFQLDTA